EANVPGGTRPPRRAGRGVPLRPALAGTLAVAVGAAAFAGVELSRSPSGPSAGPPPASTGPARPGSVSSGPASTGPANPDAWSGKPTAAWPASPSYGRASTAAQLVDFVTRAAAAAP